MSLNPEKLHTVAVYDPRLMITNERDYAVMKGGQSVLYKQYATTAANNSSLVFSCPPPSGSIVVDRKVMLYCPIRLTMTGVPAINTPLIQNGHDAPRAFGLMKSIQTMIATINNQTVSINMADIIGPLLQYNTDTCLQAGEYSVSPTYQDQFQEYGSGVGFTRSSLGLYGEGLDQTQMGNAGFPSFTIVTNPISPDGTSTVTAVVDISFCENLFLAPFLWGKHNSGGFYNVTAMDFTFNFLSGANGSRFWSHDPTVGANLSGPILTTSFQIGNQVGGPVSFTSTSGNAPLMFFTYITPNQQQILGPLSSIVYPLFDVQEYQTNNPQAGAFGSGSDFGQIVSNNIQLSSIPRRVYLWIRQQNQDFYQVPQGGCNVPDAYFQIQSINVQYQNQSGLLNSANMIQLFEVSKKNHYQGNWAQWSGGAVYNNIAWGGTGPVLGAKVGTVGSVLCLQFADDIGLQDVLDAPGKLSPSTLQVTVNYRNMAARAIVPTLFLVTVNEGVFEVESQNRATQSIGVLTSEDILDAQTRPGVSYYDVQQINGGDFWSGLKNFGQNLNSFLKDTGIISKSLPLLGLIPGVGPLISSIGTPIAKSLGYGNGVMVGGRRRSRGGAHLSRASLMDRMSEY